MCDSQCTVSLYSISSKFGNYKSLHVLIQLVLFIGEPTIAFRCFISEYSFNISILQECRNMTCGFTFFFICLLLIING